MATALPTAASFTGSTVTEAQFKTAITDLRTFLADLLGTDGVQDTALAAMRTLGGSLKPISSSTTLTDADRGAIVNVSATCTVTMPLISATANGWTVAIRSGASATTTVSAQGSDAIDGSTSITLQAGEDVILYNNSANWTVLADNSTDIEDNSITIYKMVDIVGAIEQNKGTTQTVTTSYADYLTYNVGQSARQAVILVGSVTFINPIAQTLGVRLTFAGAVVDTVAIANAPEGVVTIPIMSRIEPTTLGTRAAAIQVYKSSAVATTVVAGSLAAFTTPIKV